VFNQPILQIRELSAQDFYRPMPSATPIQRQSNETAHVTTQIRPLRHLYYTNSTDNTD